MRKAAASDDWAKLRRGKASKAQGIVEANQASHEQLVQVAIINATTAVVTAEAASKADESVWTDELKQQQDQIRESKDEWMDAYFLVTSLPIDEIDTYLSSSAGVILNRDYTNSTVLFAQGAPRVAPALSTATAGSSALFTSQAPTLPFRPVRILPPENLSIILAPTHAIADASASLVPETKDDFVNAGDVCDAMIADWSYFEAASFNSNLATDNVAASSGPVTEPSIGRGTVSRQTTVVPICYRHPEKRYRFGALPVEAELAIAPVYGETVARSRSMPGAAKGQVR